MNYPHLYIKSLLQEVKEQNGIMINHHYEYVGQRFANYHPDKYENLSKSIEEISLYIEQLNQEIVNTTKLMESKQ
jgi:hypothetical protein